MNKYIDEYKKCYNASNYNKPIHKSMISYINTLSSNPIDINKTKNIFSNRKFKVNNPINLNNMDYFKNINININLNIKLINNNNYNNILLKSTKNKINKSKNERFGIKSDKDFNVINKKNTMNRIIKYKAQRQT